MPKLKSKSTSPLVNIQQLDVVELLGNNHIRTRLELNLLKVEEYAERMRAGEKFAPAIAFDDGKDIHRATGDHRLHGALKAGLVTFPVEIRKGTQRDALLFSLQDNVRHGAALTPEDRRNGATILLRDPEWSNWSDNEIARMSGASAATVAEIRASLSSENPKLAGGERLAMRNGKPYKMKTGNIGKTKATKKKADDRAKESSVSVNTEALDQPVLELPLATTEPSAGQAPQNGPESDLALKMATQVSTAAMKPETSTRRTKPEVVTPDWNGKPLEVVLGSKKSFEGSEGIFIGFGRKKELMLDLIHDTCVENGATVIATPMAAAAWKFQNMTDKERRAVGAESVI